MGQLSAKFLTWSQLSLPQQLARHTVSGLSPGLLGRVQPRRWAVAELAPYVLSKTEIAL